MKFQCWKVHFKDHLEEKLQKSVVNRGELNWMNQFKFKLNLFQWSWSILADQALIEQSQEQNKNMPEAR